MKWVHIPPLKCALPDATRIAVNSVGAAMVLCAAVYAASASAQEGGAPAAGVDAAQAGKAGDTSPGDAVKGQAPDASVAPTNRDIELLAPRQGSAGLSRRANRKALIANAFGATAGTPAGNVRVGLFPLRPKTDLSAPRNAVGMALPGSQLPGRTITGMTNPAGTNLTGNGAVAGHAGGFAHRTPVPADAGSARHEAAINGTAMGRMAIGSGSIGGPAKDRSGINGTLIRLRH
jgi:hypothetical protein